MALSHPAADGAPRGRLSHEGIVSAAQAIVAADGYDALTMRRLAEDCGVGVMSLYRYFRTKEELLTSLADAALSELELPADDLPWDVQVAALFRSVHDVILTHPELADIFAAQPIDGVAAYRGAEVALSALRQSGLDDRGVVAAFDALSTFTAGSAQREASARLRRPEMRNRQVQIGELTNAEFPTVLELMGLLIARDVKRPFEDGLDLLLRGVVGRAADGDQA